jgi:hypothetical protein
MQLFFPLLGLACASAALCGDEAHPASVPAAAGSGMQNLTVAPDGKAILSWLEPMGDSRHALRIARWRGGGWDDVRTVAEGKNWFVNWADTPSVVQLPGGVLLAHWLQRHGTGKYGYGIRVARAPSWDGTWSEVFKSEPANVEDYSGFLSFVADPGRVGAAYLAAPSVPTGDHSAGQHSEDHRKTLRFVRFNDNGLFQSDVELDSNVCSCCPTATVPTKSGLTVAYRDRLPGEIRDISVIRAEGSTWRAPLTPYPDGWEIHGCPTDGPSMAVKDGLVALAWMTRAGGRPLVQLSVMAEDGSGSLRKPLQIDDGRPLGRPAVAFSRSGPVVVWLENTDGGTELRLRRVSTDGKRAGPSLTIARVGPARAAGLPKLAVADRKIIVAWRDGGVRSAWVEEVE